jgi:N-acetyl-anhydromuramyl-L-alanine amidase AmpD
MIVTDDKTATVEYIWKPADPRHFRAGRGGHAIKGIVLHSTCGHLAGDISTLTTGDVEVSSHWYVTKTGEIYHFVQDSDTAYHAGVVADPDWSNSCTIGIEQEHLDGEESWPDVQIAAAGALCAALMAKHGKLAIEHHAQIAFPAGRKVDPVAFPSDVFWAAYSKAALLQWTFSEVLPTA